MPNTQTLWHVPYQRNPFFTGREDVLTQLHRALQADATVALSHPQRISGLGGIGKTQTAIEYAYRYRMDYQAIFWVRADSITALTSSMVELARILELPEREAQDQEIITQAVLLVYKAQGKQSDAEALLRQALSIDAQMQGTHSESASTLNNLANLYQEQSKYQEAEALFLQALELDVQKYGSNHVEVATDLNNLALLYRIQGRYQEAEPLACRALALKEKEHGHEHPAIAKNINNLATLYYEQGLYEKAEPLYERALAIRTQVYEANHPEIANSLNNLALLYEKQGKIAQAEASFKQALAMKIPVCRWV